MVCQHSSTTTQSNMSSESWASLGITDGHIRLSVGLEDADDLIKDLEQALTGWARADIACLQSIQQHKNIPSVKLTVVFFAVIRSTRQSNHLNMSA